MCFARTKQDSAAPWAAGVDCDPSLARPWPAAATRRSGWLGRVLTRASAPAGPLLDARGLGRRGDFCHLD